jgi:23S rRNA pseudouridine2605 synthase
MSEERLQKVMAAAGVASRRACEKLIQAGRVRVNGQVVTELGTKVDPTQVEIRVDNRVLSLSAPGRSQYVYVKLYKPKGVLSAAGGDTQGYSTVVDLLPEHVNRRLFPVGRLDLRSEGLILLTDDGALAHRLTHPRFEHPKVYYVLVKERPPEEALNRLRSGVEIESGRTQPAQVDVVDQVPPGLNLGDGDRRGVWLRIVLREGKKRQIRHMIAEVGLQLHRLIRWSIGPLTLDGLRPGQSVHLSKKERTELLQQAARKPKSR